MTQLAGDDGDAHSSLVRERADLIERQSRLHLPRNLSVDEMPRGKPIGLFLETVRVVTLRLLDMQVHLPLGVKLKMGSLMK